jgi:hypothetical protein
VILIVGENLRGTRDVGVMAGRISFGSSSGFRRERSQTRPVSNCANLSGWVDQLCLVAGEGHESQAGFKISRRLFQGDVNAGGWQVGDVLCLSTFRMLWGKLTPMHQHRFIIAVNRNGCTP